jgi:hypothetical protein
MMEDYASLDIQVLTVRIKIKIEMNRDELYTWDLRLPWE